MSGGIIGVDNDHPAGALGHGLLQGMKIKLPTMVINQRIAREFYVLNIGEEIKQRITGSRDQQFITRIAQQAEYERVCLAGAGGEDDVLSRNLSTARLVVPGNCLARLLQPAW